MVPFKTILMGTNALILCHNKMVDLSVLKPIAIWIEMHSIHIDLCTYSEVGNELNCFRIKREPSVPETNTCSWELDCC